MRTLTGQKDSNVITFYFYDGWKGENKLRFIIIILKEII